MKVVTSHPALVQGSAEACPPHSGAAAQELTGIARRAFTLLHRYRASVLLVCLAIAAFALPHLAGATDLLASQKQDAKDTFGHGSTYIKVRNPMILVGGIPFLIVITKVFFSLAG
ncbi:conjugal transfer protein TraA [Pantoea agglomerans]|uniref:Conjugal transfer protein TraA n=1 Tax=Enterobacter agglomerans TaxID=549 RepID=A0A7X2MJN3_ENTAG|nr:conjugal transfer protein TraA [Pantoea agglomerans]